jgi:hypothetical protein
MYVSEKTIFDISANKKAYLALADMLNFRITRKSYKM